MDRSLRNLERQIATDGYQPTDVESFLYRAMRAQSQDDIKNFILQAVGVFNSRSKGEHLSIESTFANGSFVSVSANLSNCPVLFNVNSVSRISLHNGSENIETFELSLSYSIGAVSFPISSHPLILQPGEFYSYPIGAKNAYLGHDAILEMSAEPKCNINVIVVGQR